MTAISAVASVPAATAATGTTADSGLAAAASDPTADRFLTLLVTQLKNQDPLNPLDNAQITSQLAQLSTVSGINQLNATLTGLSASFDAKQYLQAAGLVGQDVVVDGNAMTLADGNAVGALQLPADADHVTVTIKDGSGRAVRQLDLGAQTAGVVSFAWDGRDDSGVVVKDGAFTLDVAASANGKTVSATPLAVGRVTGVAPGANGGNLQIEGVGRVDFASIRQIG